MAGGDWIKEGDPSFNTQAEQLNAWVQEFGLAHGLSAGQISQLNDRLTKWATDFPAVQAAQTALDSAVQAKVNARLALEADMRALAGTLHSNVNMTDAKRSSAGLKVRRTSRTRAAIPTTRVVLTVDTSMRLQHTLHWKDETTPTSKAKPAGVMGLEIRRYLGPTPPADPEQCEIVALDRGTPRRIQYDGADAGKIVHYIARWVNTRGEKGPWSKTLSATIGA